MTGLAALVWEPARDPFWALVLVFAVVYTLLELRGLLRVAQHRQVRSDADVWSLAAGMFICLTVLGSADFERPLKRVAAGVIALGAATVLGQVALCRWRSRERSDS